MDLESICMQFYLPGSEFKISPLGKGLINDTYLVIPMESNDKGKFVLQRINKIVFTEPDKVMHNLIRINEHLQSKGAKFQELIKSKQGNLFFIDPNEDYWRITKYLDHTITLSEANTTDIAYEAAKTYGKFLNDLHDLNINEIFETIPEFHNYSNRIKQFKDSLQFNAFERSAKCKKEIETTFEKIDYIHTFYALKLPLRVIHSDTKIDNILFDSNSFSGRLVIDLDIAMPGSILFDYGDMIRSFTNTLKEDDPDLNSIKVKLDIFEFVTKGFLESTKYFMQQNESEYMLLGAKLVILVQAIRNLTDYLNGDIYYKINYDDHNLHRAQNQLTLLTAIENQEKYLHKIVRKYL
jgi:serine/threonine protein kinase